MLQKRRDLGSIPDGLCFTAAKTVKGTAVVKKYNSVKNRYELAKPSTADEAANIYGFVTQRIDDVYYTDKYYDEIPADTRAVAYTLVANNEWATTEFVDGLAIGDKATVEYTGSNAGKLKKASTGDIALFEVVNMTPAMGGYEDALVDVRVLPVANTKKEA